MKDELHQTSLNPNQSVASSNMNHSDWTWEQACKKWFFLRFTLLLIALALAITQAYLYFGVLPRYQQAVHEYSVPKTPQIIHNSFISTSTQATTTKNKK